MTPPTSTRAPVILHSITAADSEFLYQLASDPTIRAQSLHPEIPTRAQHEAWITQFLADPKRHGWVVLSRHQPAAFVRLDHISRLGAKIHVAVHRDFRGRGIGQAAIYHGTLFARNQDWGVIASIKPGNVASINAFEACGYWLVGPGKEGDVDVVVYAIS